MTLLLKDRDVLIVGGSTLAERVIPGYVQGGARVTVCEGREPVGEDGALITTTIGAWADEGRITLHRTHFTPAMLWGKALVVVCDPGMLRDVVVHSRRHGIMVDDATGGEAIEAARLEGRRASRAGDLAGTVALVGGGPGDPGLITVEGRRLLRLADVVVADHLGPLSLLGQLDPDVEVIDAGKLPYGRAMAQERINELLIHRAKELGLFVVRLKGGDPYLFGRGFEEMTALREAGVDVVEVPGITSAIAVPAAAGIPVTHRGVTHDLTIVSGHVPPGHPKSLVEWDALAKLRGTLVVIMGVRNGAAIADALIAGGRSADTPAAVIQEGTTSKQRTFRCTLGTIGAVIADEEVKPPAVLIVGDVAGDLPGA